MTQMDDFITIYIFWIRKVGHSLGSYAVGIERKGKFDSVPFLDADLDTCAKHVAGTLDIYKKAIITFEPPFEYHFEKGELRISRRLGPEKENEIIDCVYESLQNKSRK